MVKKIHVKPSSPELLVRNPATMEFIPAEGAHVPHDSYWDRRLQCGDVVIVHPEKKPAAAPAQSSKPKHGGA